MTSWEVTYKLPSTGSKYHKMVVEANYQHDAKKIAQAQIPSAILCGGPRRMWIMKDWKELYSNLPSEELDKIAVLRVIVQGMKTLQENIDDIPPQTL